MTIVVALKLMLANLFALIACALTAGGAKIRMDAAPPEPPLFLPPRGIVYTEVASGCATLVVAFLTAGLWLAGDGFSAGAFGLTAGAWLGLHLKIRWIIAEYDARRP